MKSQEQTLLTPTPCFAALSLAALLVFAASAAADDATPQAKRTILERHDQSEVSGKEILLGTAVLPAAAVIGWHTHAGDESGYVMEGSLILKSRGNPDRTLKAGDHFFIARGVVHSVLAAPGTAGGTAVSTWVIDKGKPLATPVD